MGGNNKFLPDGIVTIDKISWDTINTISDSSGRVSDMIHIADEED